MRSAQLFGGPKRVLLTAGALLTVLAAVIAVGTPRRALAQDGADVCDLHTLRGSYLFTATGHNIVGGVPQPKAIVEALAFDGDGTVLVTAGTLSINGNIVQGVSGSGVYTLDAACNGTITFSTGPAFDIFTAPRGKQAWMIQSNPGTVLQGTVTKLSP